MGSAPNRFEILGDDDVLELPLKPTIQPSPKEVLEALKRLSVKGNSNYHRRVGKDSAKQDVEVNTGEKAFGKNRSMSDDSGHPALVVHPNGYQLNIKVVFDPDLPSSAYIEEGEKLHLDDRILDLLPPLYDSIQKIILQVTFPPPAAFTADKQKCDHAWFIREMSKSINNFKGLNCLHIKYKMPVFDWDQFKTAAYFYRLEFREWSLQQNVEDRGWVRLSFGSRLEKRLTSYAVKLIEREQEKERAAQECEYLAWEFEEKVA